MIISISGGKGGTGKSTVAVNLAIELSKFHKVRFGDLDVEAPNDYILLGVKLEKGEPIKIMYPHIDYKGCIKCGICGKVCDTGALLISRDGLPLLLPRLCSGCRACYLICPTKTILEGERLVGYLYENKVSINSHKFDLVTGVLREGEEHTPPVVRIVKNKLLSRSADIYLIDTSAGTANHVSIAIDKSNLLIAVTEPTPLGLHDLEMILEVASELNIDSWVIINRDGIGPVYKHIELAKKYNINKIYRIPYSKAILESYIRGVPIVVYNEDSKESMIFREIVNDIIEVY